VDELGLTLKSTNHIVRTAQLAVQYFERSDTAERAVASFVNGGEPPTPDQRLDDVIADLCSPSERVAVELFFAVAALSTRASADRTTICSFGHQHHVTTGDGAADHNPRRRCGRASDSVQSVNTVRRVVDAGATFACRPAP